MYSILVNVWPTVAFGCVDAVAMSLMLCANVGGNGENWEVKMSEWNQSNYRLNGNGMP